MISSGLLIILDGFADAYHCFRRATHGRMPLAPPAQYRVFYARMRRDIIFTTISSDHFGFLLSTRDFASSTVS